MVLKIEFGESRSRNFQRVLGICKRLPSFKATDEEGRVLYSVEFDKTEFVSAYAVIEFVRCWQSVAYYMDGVLVSRDQACREVYGVMWEDSKKHGAGLALRRDIRAADGPEDLIRRQKPPTDV